MLELRGRKGKWNIFMLAVVIGFYLVIQLLVNSGMMTSYNLQLLSLACIHVMLVVGLNLIVGFTGQLALGHAGFLAIGSYLSASLTVFYQVPFLISILISGIAAGFIGILIGLPALRLRGDYLAIATLGFGEIIRVAILNIPSVGGARGFFGIPDYTSFGIAYFLAVLTVIIIRNFINSDHGRACIAIREDEIASDSLGINTTYYKVAAFAIAAFFAGAAGGLFSHYMQYISPAPSQIGFLKSIDILIMVVLGGLGSITGSVITAVFLTILPEILRVFAQYRMIIYPILLILMMVFRPSGLMGGHELSYDLLEKLYKKFKRKNTDKGMSADGAK